MQRRETEDIATTDVHPTTEETDVTRSTGTRDQGATDQEADREVDHDHPAVVQDKTTSSHFHLDTATKYQKYKS